jgi:hypothetical protein
MAWWLSCLPLKYPNFAPFWSALYNEWQSYEDHEELREMFAFFRNVRLLDPRQTATVPYDPKWPKDPNIRALLARWYKAEGQTCSLQLEDQSPEEYWAKLRGYGSLPQWALVAIHCPMGSVNEERVSNFSRHVGQEDRTETTLKTRFLLASNSDHDFYGKARHGRKRQRDEEGALTVAATVVVVGELQAEVEVPTDPNPVPHAYHRYNYRAKYHDD